MVRYYVPAARCFLSLRFRPQARYRFPTFSGSFFLYHSWLLFSLALYLFPVFISYFHRLLTGGTPLSRFLRSKFALNPSLDVESRRINALRGSLMACGGFKGSVGLIFKWTEMDQAFRNCNLQIFAIFIYTYIFHFSFLIRNF